MSDPECIQDGDTVIIKKPPPPDPPKTGYGCEILLLLVAAIIAFVVLYEPAPSTSTSTSLQSQPLDCAPGITIGQIASIVSSSSVRLRSSPGYIGKGKGDTLQFLSTGDQVIVIDGPEFKDGLCWWFVEYQDFQGWIANHSNDGTVLLSANP